MLCRLYEKLMVALRWDPPVIIEPPEKKEVPIMITEPREDYDLYDYIPRGWGHDIAYWKEKDLSRQLYTIIGHGSADPPINKKKEGFINWGSCWDIKKGDLLRFRMKNKEVKDFLVIEITYKRDPSDMFEATIQPYERVKNP